MIAIRLKRMGTKNRLKWRITVSDSRTSRDSSLIEELGFYNPMKNPPEVKIRRDRYEAWIQKGAQPSATVRALMAQEKRSSASH